MPNSRLQSELKKRNPFDSLEQEAFLNLIRTNDRVQIEFERLFRNFGVTSAQYNILRILRGEGRPMPILEIASRTIAVVPGITGLIDRLERAELVARERSKEDRRVVFVSITPAGTKLLGQLDQPVLDLHSEILKPLSEPETRELVRLLEKVRTSLDPAPHVDPPS